MVAVAQHTRTGGPQAPPPVVAPMSKATDGPFHGGPRAGTVTGNAEIDKGIVRAIRAFDSASHSPIEKRLKAEIRPITDKLFGKQPASKYPFEVTGVSRLDQAFMSAFSDKSNTPLEDKLRIRVAPVMADLMKKAGIKPDATVAVPGETSARGPGAAGPGIPGSPNTKAPPAGSGASSPLGTPDQQQSTGGVAYVPDGNDPIPAQSGPGITPEQMQSRQPGQVHTVSAPSNNNGQSPLGTPGQQQQQSTGGVSYTSPGADPIPARTGPGAMPDQTAAQQPGQVRTVPGAGQQPGASGGTGQATGNTGGSSVASASPADIVIMALRRMMGRDNLGVVEPLIRLVLGLPLPGETASAGLNGPVPGGLGSPLGIGGSRAIPSGVTDQPAQTGT